MNPNDIMAFSQFTNILPAVKDCRGRYPDSDNAANERSGSDASKDLSSVSNEYKPGEVRFVPYLISCIL